MFTDGSASAGRVAGIGSEAAGMVTMNGKNWPREPTRVTVRPPTPAKDTSTITTHVPEGMADEMEQR